MIWSIACMAKFQVMNSMIGRRPANAAPTPMPAKPCSVIGVSTTRCGAEFLQQALGDLVGALILGDFLAHDEDVLVAAHLLGHRLVQRLADGHLDHLDAGRQIGIGGGLEFRRSAARQRPPWLRPAPAPARRSRRLRWRGARPARAPPRRRLAFAQHQRDRGVDLHAFGALGDQDLLDLAAIDAFDFHRRLVGLDLGQHVAGLDGVADLDQPFGEFALFHGGRERGHQDIGHVALPLRRRRRCRSRARTQPAPHRPWRNRRPR